MISNSNQNPRRLFNVETDKPFLKFMWKLKGLRPVKNTVKNNAVRHTLK